MGSSTSESGFRRLRKLTVLAVAGLALAGPFAIGEEAKVAPSQEPAKLMETVGEPTRVTIEPKDISLHGPRAYQQILVTGEYADGSVRDLTRLAQYASSEAGVATVTDQGVIHAVGNGSSTVSVRAGSLEATVPVAVVDFDKPRPINFKHEVMAAFTRAGCNSGACHGTPSGKNGFRLSLQGYLPDQDFEVLTREVFGRRTNSLQAANSLILTKGLATIPHEGGKKLWSNEETYKVIEKWIAEGCQASPPESTPELASLEILPKGRTLRNEATHQQVVVIAHYADGSKRDVTPLVKFNSSDEQVATVGKNGQVSFHKRGSVAILCRYLHLIDNAKIAYIKEVPGFVWNNPPEANYIDKHVFAKLNQLQILPSDVCTDEEFVRRVYLDVTGMLPTMDEARAFLADADPAKRAKLIDRLLEKPEYADFWAMKWADVLRNTRKQVAYRGAHNYRRFLAEAFEHNRPFHELVSELITSTGDTMMNPAANYYRVARDPQDCAETTAQLFLGVRMQCAKCHNHPFERWTQDDYYGFAAFFARVKQKKPNPNGEAEVIFLARAGEVNHLRTNQTMKPKAPGFPAFDVQPNEDRREYLAQWLSRPDNPFFARSIVNRIWFHLLGKGIVDPVDDFRDSNPPCNEELLTALADDFTKSNFDFKHMVRTILNSRTYQLSARTNEFNKDDEKYFSRAYTKLLTAEQLLDAISTATGVAEKYAGMPLGTRAFQLPDGEINHPFLQAFGQPTRELACECARESESTLNQALNLINGNVVHTKLRDENNRIGQLMKAGKPDSDIIAELYFATLSRPARPAEIEGGLAHIKNGEDRRRALEDIHWALLNCKEFLFRH
ncbi:MAG: DUF1553 domain-containing protein [Planctomycetota bacterium]